jgi:hypothetical protein
LAIDNTLIVKFATKKVISALYPDAARELVIANDTAGSFLRLIFL